MIDYDIVCIGGGISGLFACTKLQTNKPKILIIEKNNILGGRVKTNYTSVKKIKISYEEGGARFSKYHINLLKLLKDYELKDLYKINKIDTYLSTNNDKSLTFKQIINKMIKDTNKIDSKILKGTTVYKLCNKLYGSKVASNMNDRYHYYSELHIMNALDALNTFKKDLDETEQFFILGGGLSRLIQKMHDSFIKKGGKVILNCYLDSINYDSSDNSYTLKCLDNKDKIILIDTKKIILTIGHTGLKKIKYISSKIPKLLDSVKESPLHRIYAVYPKNKNGKVWFYNLKTTVTNLPIKFIIPIDKNTGLIMISYTDGKLADYWLDIVLSGKGKSEIKNNLIQLFPDLDIPEPIYFKNHYWKNGATYWKTNVNSKDIANKMIKPLKDEEIYICGDNYSNRQAWIEGGLETASEVVKKIGNKHGGKLKKSIKNYNKSKSQTKKSSKLSKYTMEEVMKHDKKKDAWLVINNKVYNVTKWIDKHPGGPVILRGLGKDATEMFNNVNHSSGARRRLTNFLIGKL